MRLLCSKDVGFLPANLPRVNGPVALRIKESGMKRDREETSTFRRAPISLMQGLKQS